MTNPFPDRSFLVRQHIAQAIKTMREACDTAERSLLRDGTDDMILRVPHALAWGHANATTSTDAAVMWHTTGNNETLMHQREELNRLQAQIDQLKGKT